MKINKVFLIVVAFFITVFLCYGLNLNAFTSNSIEDKIYCTATLDDNYDDKSIIVTLSNANHYY